MDPELNMKSKFRRQFDELEPTFHEHHQSHFRMIYEHEEVLKKIDRIVHFGLQGHKVCKKDVELIQKTNDDKSELVYLNKDIRSISS